jgi:prefoldin subunit 5
MAVNSSIIKMRMKDLNDEVEILNNRMTMLTHELEGLDKVLRDYATHMVKVKTMKGDINDTKEKQRSSAR